MRLFMSTAWLGFTLAACSLPQKTPSPTATEEIPPPAGASCLSTLDCAPGDVCMAQACRGMKTSASGEILAALAASHAQQNQHAAAAQAFGSAVDAFKKQGSPVPAELFCGLAAASLQGASTREARELAARHADQCLRASTPGQPGRSAVVQLLASLTTEGLDVAHFDEPQPAQVFFSAEPERPRADAIEIEFDLPTRDAPGFAELTAGLRTPEVRDSISRCFITAWEKQRQDRAEAKIALKFTSRMRDMGDYDTYAPQLEVSAVADATTENGSTFAACVVAGIQTALGTGPKVNRVVAWEEALRVVARL